VCGWQAVEGSHRRKASLEMVVGVDRKGGAVKGEEEELAEDAVGQLEVPLLRIVMLVCGTRGDVQPFIALALKLKVTV
jgi:hypothetical protein